MGNLTGRRAGDHPYCFLCLRVEMNRVRSTCSAD